MDSAPVGTIGKLDTTDRRKKEIFCFSFKLARGSCSNIPSTKPKSHNKRKKKKDKDGTPTDSTSFEQLSVCCSSVIIHILTYKFKFSVVILDANNALFEAVIHLK